MTFKACCLKLASCKAGSLQFPNLLAESLRRLFWGVSKKAAKYSGSLTPCPEPLPSLLGTSSSGRAVTTVLDTAAKPGAGLGPSWHPLKCSLHLMAVVLSNALRIVIWFTLI